MSAYDDRPYRRGYAPGSLARLMEELDKAVPTETQDPEVRPTVVRIRVATAVMFACASVVLAITVIAWLQAHR
jgi:hypothetical protein